MSTFQVLIKRISAVENHHNADRLDVARVDGYEFIVKRGEYQAGNLVAYIPEAAIIPEWLLRRLCFWDHEKQKGLLHGKDGNRVKAIKLRGVLSQGLCVPVLQDSATTGVIMTGESEMEFAPVTEGDEVAGLLGITKYEPPIPLAMAGEVFNAGTDLTVAFDVENWKSCPDVFADGEEVIFTEKLHGTFTGIAILPLKDAHPEAFGKNRNILIFSKGLGAKGLVFKNNERNQNNLYVRSTRALVEKIDNLIGADGVSLPLYILGETFGPGVQDLTYGKELGFRAFAMAEGYTHDRTWFPWCDIEAASSADMFGFDTVPILCQGPFSVQKMQEYTDGKTVLDSDHIREGIVMTGISRPGVFIKSVSGDYLTRKNGTEFN